MIFPCFDSDERDESLLSPANYFQGFKYMAHKRKIIHFSYLPISYCYRTRNRAQILSFFSQNHEFRAVHGRRVGRVGRDI
jgi:hypothetical protein